MSKILSKNSIKSSEGKNEHNDLSSFSQSISLQKDSRSITISNRGDTLGQEILQSKNTLHSLRSSANVDKYIAIERMPSPEEIEKAKQEDFATELNRHYSTAITGPTNQRNGKIQKETIDFLRKYQAKQFESRTTTMNRELAQNFQFKEKYISQEYVQDLAFKGQSFHLVPGQRKNMKKGINFSKNYQSVDQQHQRQVLYHASDRPKSKEKDLDFSSIQIEGTNFNQVHTQKLQIAAQNNQIKAILNSIHERRNSQLNSVRYESIKQRSIAHDDDYTFITANPPDFKSRSVIHSPDGRSSFLQGSTVFETPAQGSITTNINIKPRNSSGQSTRPGQSPQTFNMKVKRFWDYQRGLTEKKPNSRDASASFSVARSRQQTPNTSQLNEWKRESKIFDSINPNDQNIQIQGAFSASVDRDFGNMSINSPTNFEMGGPRHNISGGSKRANYLYTKWNQEKVDDLREKRLVQLLEHNLMLERRYYESDQFKMQSIISNCSNVITNPQVTYRKFLNENYLLEQNISDEKEAIKFQKEKLRMEREIEQLKREEDQNQVPDDPFEFFAPKSQEEDDGEDPQEKQIQKMMREDSQRTIYNTQEKESIVQDFQVLSQLKKAKVFQANQFIQKAFGQKVVKKKSTALRDFPKDISEVQ